MKTEPELWHDYMIAEMTSAPDAHPAECAEVADQCLAEYRERWMSAEDAAAARRIIAETTTDQSPPPRRSIYDENTPEGRALYWLAMSHGYPPEGFVRANAPEMLPAYEALLNRILKSAQADDAALTLLEGRNA